MKRKFITLSILLVLIANIFIIPVSAQEVRLDINFNRTYLKTIESRGMVMVPAEETATILNLLYNYDEVTKTAKLTTRHEKRELLITADQNKYYYNGRAYTLTYPAVLYNGNLYVSYDLFDRLGFNSQYTSDTGARVVNILSKGTLDMSYFGEENNVLVNKNPKLDLSYVEQIKLLEERYGKTFKEQDSAHIDYSEGYKTNNSLEVYNKNKYSLLVIKRLDSQTKDLLKATLEALSKDGLYLYEKIEEAFYNRNNLKSWADRNAKPNDIYKNLWYRVNGNDYGDTSYRFAISDEGFLEVEITDQITYTPYGIEWNKN